MSMNMRSIGRWWEDEDEDDDDDEIGDENDESDRKKKIWRYKQEEYIFVNFYKHGC